MSLLTWIWRKLHIRLAANQRKRNQALKLLECDGGAIRVRSLTYNGRIIGTYFLN